MMSLSNARLFFQYYRKAMAVTRSEIIAQLKSRGVRGRLSKMRKHELQELLKKSAAPGQTKEPIGISLEPDDQAGGHCAGKLGSKKLAKACHDAYGDSNSARARARASWFSEVADLGSTEGYIVPCI